MSDTRHKVALVVSTNIEVRGEGDAIQLQLSAHRIKKTGGYEFFEMKLDVGRWTVKRLAQQIASMHVRDRKRLERELARIEREIEAIKQPETT